MIAFYDLQQHRSLAFLYGQDAGVSCLSWSAWALWFLGYPAQALKRSQEALALAQELDHPFTLGFAQCIAGMIFHQFRREGQAVREWSETEMRLSTEEGFAVFQAAATIFRGLSQAEEGQIEEGIAQMLQGLAAFQATGMRLQHPHFLALLAEALALVEKTGERYYGAELYRLKGELLLMQGDEAEAEASLDKAIEVARRQQAKSWELRATMSLCRLWQRQDKREEARQRLAEVYGWFTEGFDTPDLKEARALLAEFAGDAGQNER